MDMDDKPTIIETWILASRPKTLPAAASPVLVGSAIAFYFNGFQFYPAMAALLAALLLQIGANLSNDLFDYYRGADEGERLGPTRVTQAGLLTPKQVAIGTSVVFLLAAMIGVYLVWVAGWVILVIGLTSIIAALAYTGGPFPFGYHGLGEFFVFIFFGIVAVCGTFFVQTRMMDGLVFWSSFPMGFLITAILIVNNLRDIDTDRKAGKKTMAVRFGSNFSKIEFLSCLIAAWIVPLVLWLTQLLPMWILFAWVSIPFARPIIHQVFQWTGKPLNKTLAGTGRFTLIYALLFSLGVLLSK